MEDKEILEKLIELETRLTLMFDSDARIGLAILEEIRKIKNERNERNK